MTKSGSAAQKKKKKRLGDDKSHHCRSRGRSAKIKRALGLIS